MPDQNERQTKAGAFEVVAPDEIEIILILRAVSEDNRRNILRFAEAVRDFEADSRAGLDESSD